MWNASEREKTCEGRKQSRHKPRVNISVPSNKKTSETDMASQGKMKEQRNISREAEVEKVASNMRLLEPAWKLGLHLIQRAD